MVKKKKSNKPPADKHADFIRVVTPRVNKALTAIGLIGNQAGAAYAPTEDEVADMFAVLRKKITDTEKCYQKGQSADADFAFGQ